MLESKIQERIAEWEKKKLKNSKLPSHQRLHDRHGCYIKLDLSECEISAVDFILKIKDIKSLDLSSNLIEDISPFKNYDGLKCLILQNNLIRDALPLIEFKTIETVNFRNNRFPILYGKQKTLIRKANPNLQIYWDDRLRTHSL